ncbi:MAG: polysaccharide biosynthesis protein [Myxococcales bacterium]|nr:polysaccharide biosynthesis protein [Myxococcales bacterium]
MMPLRAAQFVIDAIIVIAALVAAYLIRFDGHPPRSFWHQLATLGPVIAIARMFVNRLTGVYRVVWRYVGLHEAFLFARSVAIVSGVLLVMRVALPSATQMLRVPIGVIIMEGTFTFLGMAVVRLARRVLHDRSLERDAGGVTPTVLVGAGQGGLDVAKEALRHPALGIEPLGFLDDDRTKHGMAVHGLRVLGTLDDAENILRQTGARQLIITTNAIAPKRLLALMDEARSLDVSVRIVPRLFEVLGEGSVGQALREVRIEDLLSRDPIPPSLSMDQLRQIFGSKRILVTGAGGSIGSEICRQLSVMAPAKLCLVERDENNLFEVDRELRSLATPGTLVPVLADITDPKAMERLFKEFQPEVVFHAAAYKHVPVMERFPAAAVRNNVVGTSLLAELADRHGTEAFVMISTDKAVRPTSVMGASKRLAEVAVQRLAASSKTRFSCVRFGNVLGSRGSVVPIFREQILAGGPVTVTHPEATRYFMTIPEACNLVLQASTLGSTGEIFLLDMGEPVKILDLARQMIHLMGASGRVDVQIVGVRPGEKLFEELRTDAENLSPTELRRVFRLSPEAFDWTHVQTILDRLDFLTRAGDNEGIREALRDLGIGYVQPPTRTTGPSDTVR